MAEYPNLYSDPKIYNVVFERDVSGEVAFLADAFLQVRRRRMSSCLEIACGPGYHTAELSSLGYVSDGFDLQPEMVEFARERAAALELSSRFFVADMTDFQTERKYDLVYSVLDGVDSLTTPEQFCNHLDCVANSLNAGGLYIIDNAHPKDISISRYSPEVYSGQMGDMSAVFEYAYEPPEIDLVRGTAKTKCRTRVFELGALRHEAVSEAVEKIFSVPEVDLLARLSGRFKLAKTWGGFSIEQSLVLGAESSRMIIALELLG